VSHSRAAACHVISQEVEALEAALDPTPENSRYRFRALLHEMRPDPATRVKPKGVDELRWREALEEVGGERNAEHMWPVQAQGFTELSARYNAQTKELAAQTEALKHANAALAARQTSQRCWASAWKPRPLRTAGPSRCFCFSPRRFQQRSQRRSAPPG
jgi:hypothetical protein